MATKDFKVKNGIVANNVIESTSGGFKFPDSTTLASSANLVLGSTVLTTPGAVPFVTASGVLGQDASNLFWDNTNKRLGVSVLTSPTVNSNVSIQLYPNGTAQQSGLALFNSNTGGNQYGELTIVSQGAGAEFRINSGANSGTAGAIVFRPNLVERARFAVNTGNFLLGTTTDTNFRLNVASSGSAGTAQFYDATATTGVTQVVVRGGAGQSGTKIMTVFRPDGATIGQNYMYSVSDAFIAQVFHSGNNDGIAIMPGSIQASVNTRIQFHAGSITAVNSSAPDLSLSRASAGVLQIGDGGSNANGMVRAAVTSTISSSNGTAPLFVNGLHTRFISNVGYIESVEAGTLGRELIIRGNPLKLGNSNSSIDFVTLSSAGTFTLLNPTPTTGVTQMIIQAGAGQSGTKIMTVSRPDGTTIGQNYMYSVSDAFIAQVFHSGNNDGIAIMPGTIQASVNTRIQFHAGSITAVNSSAADLALSRRAAGLLAIDSSTAIGTTPGNARDVMARGFYAAETTSDPSAADLSIAGSNAQDTFRLYMKNDKLVVAYQRSGTVNYLTIPLDGATTTFTQSTTAP